MIDEKLVEQMKKSEEFFTGVREKIEKIDLNIVELEEIDIFGEDVEDTADKILSDIRKILVCELKPFPNAMTKVLQDDVQDRIWETIKDHVDCLVDYPEYKKDLKEIKGY